MSQYFEIHPENPQKRLIKQAADIIHNGGVIVYPTDSSYAIGCHLGDKQAVKRLRRIRQLDDKHKLTLVCSDLSAISTYAKISNAHYRMLKSLTPGDLDKVIEGTPFQPPPTVGMSIVGLLSDGMQHAGQAAYVRGLRQGMGWH